MTEIISQMLQTIKGLLSPYKGILAADESIKTIGKRFSSVGLENTRENRKDYRKMLFTTPNLENHISGVIVYEETFFEEDDDERLVQPLFDNDILVGVKVDKGLIELPFGLQGSKEKMTEGLDGLKERCKRYLESGAKFTKWRCIFEVDSSKGTPTMLGIERNASILAQYASISQSVGLVPIVEPEIIVDNCRQNFLAHTLSRSILSKVFYALMSNGVELDLMLLKANVVRSGLQESNSESELNEIAIRSLNLFQDTVPVAVPGILLLSGGMNEADATSVLKKIKQLPGDKPWRISFSFGRGLQKTPLEIWSDSKEEEDRYYDAQHELYEKARANGFASQGSDYQPDKC